MFTSVALYVREESYCSSTRGGGGGGTAYIKVVGVFHACLRGQLERERKIPYIIKCVYMYIKIIGQYMLLFLTIHAIELYLFIQSRPLAQNQAINNCVHIKLNKIKSIVDLCTKSSHHIDNKPYHWILAAKKQGLFCSFWVDPCSICKICVTVGGN